MVLMEIIYYIFLDANFLLLPAQFRIDIYEQFNQMVPGPYKLIVPSAVFTELDEKIAKESRSTVLRQNYKLARQILEQHKYEIFEAERDFFNLEQSKTHSKQSENFQHKTSVDDFLLEIIHNFECIQKEKMTNNEIKIQNQKQENQNQENQKQENQNQEIQNNNTKFESEELRFEKIKIEKTKQKNQKTQKKKYRVFLATNDKELRKKALQQGIPTIFLRQKKRLDVEFPEI
ncbi:hypothetical protein [Candidatus Harpocratesius sp.]